MWDWEDWRAAFISRSSSVVVEILRSNWAWEVRVWSYVFLKPVFMGFFGIFGGVRVLM